MRKKQTPHIVMIVLDTHRYDRLTTYGYKQNTSPNIDAFARQSTIFESGVSCAQWTIPSHASMFTGEYPTTHQTLQAHQTLNPEFETVASLLKANGYKTIGFCNNPLVGILNNGLKRGFETFYNYSGAVPSIPSAASRLPKPLNKMWEWYTQQLRKLSYPFQNAFAHSDTLFRVALHPLFVPLWTKVGKFKGDTAQSITDTYHHLKTLKSTTSQPHFIFLNLMETHTPYTPPETFINKFAPYFKEERQARDFIRTYNTQPFRWFLPLVNPLNPNEKQIMNDIYDAEVAYQDHTLSQLLEYLTEDEIADNTLTIIVGDHGEGLGEHNFVGHSFVAYQELIHVPLIIKFPQGFANGQRIPQTVSTRRLFHTILDTANIQIYETETRPATDVKQMSLTRTVHGQDPEQELVFSEAYAPNTFLTMMENHVPHLIDTFHCRLNRRAIYQGHHKLVRIDGIQDELFDLQTDPLETNNLETNHTALKDKLANKLDTFMVRALARRPENWQANDTLNLEEDENLLKQLRALGYIE